ncbi:MAG: hypothetical protein ACOC1X_02705 [Promethearchaeota archaeon]
MIVEDLNDRKENITVATCRDCGKTYELNELDWHETSDYGVEHLQCSCPECGTYYLRIERYTEGKLKSFAENSFKINEYIKLKLENGETQIYVQDQLFSQCKYLLLNIKRKNVRQYDNINSIDEIRDIYDHSLEHDKSQEGIDSRTEFKGHCSNLQAWYEHNYDTRLLDSRLAFPLLRRLTEAGDLLAKRVFKDEIAKRISSGYSPVIEYLFKEGYFNYFNKEEVDTLLEDIDDTIERIRYKIKLSDYKFRFEVRPLNYLDDKKSNMRFYSISEYKKRFRKLNLSKFEYPLYDLRRTSGYAIKYCYFMISSDLEFLEGLFNDKTENCKLGISNLPENRYNYFIDYDSKIVIDFPMVSIPLEKFSEEMSKKKRLKARAERLWEKYNLTDKIKS